MFGADPAGFEIDCAISPSGRSGLCVDEFRDAGLGGNFALVAAPDAGSQFAGWTGCEGNPGLSLTCPLGFDAGRDTTMVVTAAFTLIPDDPPPSAHTITWTGDAGTEVWLDPANWDLDRVPASTDSVVIGGSASVRLTDDPAPEVTVRQLTLAGTLELRGGVTLNVSEGIDGASGEVLVHGAPGLGAYSELYVGAASALSWLRLEGAAIFGGITHSIPYDEHVDVSTGLLSVTQVTGASRPSLTYVRLVTGGGEVSGDFDIGTATLEVAETGSLLWSPTPDNASPRLGPTGFSSGRLVVRGGLQVTAFGARINSEVYNYGEIYVTRTLLMEYGGENHGLMRATDVDLGQLRFLANTPGQPREWTFGANSEVSAVRMELSANAHSEGRFVGERLQMTGSARSDTLWGGGIEVDTLVVGARVWLRGAPARPFVRTIINASGAELQGIPEGGTDPVAIGTRYFLFGAGSTLANAHVVADSVAFFQGVLGAGGHLEVGSYGLLSQGEVVGQGGVLEVGAGGTLDLNPAGVSSTANVRTAGETAGGDLRILNHGTILKRGLGRSLVRGCFDPAGGGSIVTGTGATAADVVALPCP